MCYWGYFFAIFFIKNSQLKLLFLLLLPLLFRELGLPIINLLTINNNIKTYIKISFSSLLVKLLLIAILFFYNINNIYLYLLPIYGENIIYIIFLMQTGFKKGINFKIKAPKKLLTIFAVRTLWGWLCSIIFIMSLRIDRIILLLLLNVNDFAYYSAAAQIGDNWYYVGTILVNAFASVYIYQGNKKECMKKAIKVTSICGVVLLSIAFIICLISKSIIIALYGITFTKSSSLLQANTIALILLPIDMLLCTSLMYAGKIRLITFKALVSFIFTPLLIFLLYPQYHLYSGAMAIGINLIGQLLLTILFLSKIRSS